VRSGRAAGLKILVSLAALLCWTPAAAADGAYKQVRGWSIYRNETHCSAYMMFENGEAVGFSYDAPGRSTRIIFSDKNATTLEDGASPSLDVLLRQPDGTVDHSWERTVFMVTVDDDGRRTLSSRWLGPPSLESFKSATLVGFYDGERQIGVFNLRGTAAALQEVERCSATLRG
jgi:YD repeat-containing protein